MNEKAANILVVVLTLIIASAIFVPFAIKSIEDYNIGLTLNPLMLESTSIEECVALYKTVGKDINYPLSDTNLITICERFVNVNKYIK